MQGLILKMHMHHYACHLAQSTCFKILADNYFINTFGYFSAAGFITSALFKKFFDCDLH